MGYPLHVGAVTILLFAAAITGSALADGLDNARAGRAALSEAEYDLAIHLFTGAIRSGELSLDDLAHAFYNRGVAYGETAEYDRALQDYTTAIGLAPDDVTGPREPGDRLREDGHGRARRQRGRDTSGSSPSAPGRARAGRVDVAAGNSVQVTTANGEESSAATSPDSFTWVDGKTYRYLGGELLCAEDGTLVVWQRANAAGKFAPLRATAQNCGLGKDP